MTFKETLDYLYEQLPMFQRQGKSAYKTDLVNTIAFCNGLGNPQYKFKSIHIAGTNGKGSTAHALASVLQHAGYKTGLYTSPHLKSFTERIKINGLDIPEVEVVKFVDKNKTLLESIEPSFFETTVAMAFDYFANSQVDVAVIEVGLGGRLDSTNVIVPEISVITNISLDHVDILGNNILSIAKEKAGIIKPGVPVVVTEHQHEIADVFEAISAENGSPIYFGSDRYQVFTESSGSFQVTDNGGNVIFNQLSMDLYGNYQRKNIPGILTAIDLLKEKDWKIHDNAIINGLKNIVKTTKLKGRWQTLQQNPPVICDIGHNVAGIHEIVKSLNKIPFNNLFMIMGMVKDKDVDSILALLPVDASYYWCDADNPRMMKASELAIKARAHGLGGELGNNVNDALHQAKRLAAKNDLIFVGGSAFLIAEINDL